MENRYRKYDPLKCSVCGKGMSIRSDHINKHCGKCSHCMMLDRWKDEAYRAKTQKSHLGYKASKQHRENMSKSKRGLLPKNLLLIQSNHTLAYGESCFNGLLKSYRISAKNRNLQFLLSKDTFRELTKTNCFYCGANPSAIRRAQKQTLNGEYVYNGIDRVDNSIGYVDGNVVACCKNCNYAKRQMGIGEFLTHIKRIYDKHFPCDALGSNSELSK